jgi:peptidoglycan/LPS O-acetylase OafA/YrhL
LDLIRGVAAQAVLVGHAMVFLDIYPAADDSHPLLIQNGGVLVFFVLSGFLISYTVEQKRESAQYTFKTYVADRFVRIFTAYAPALVFILAIDLVFQAIRGPERYPFASAFDLKTFAGNALMLQDFPVWEFLPRLPLHFETRITSFGSGRPLWTVAIEWWMYLLYGFLVFRSDLRSSAVVKALAFVVLLIVPLWNIGGRGNGLTFVWFAGVAVCLLRNSKLGRLRSVEAAVIAGILALASAWRLRLAHLDVYEPLFAALLAAIFLFGLIALRSVEVRGHGISARVIRRVADYSFSLYLVHYSLLVFIAEYKANISRWWLFPLALVACNAVAYAFAGLTEFHHKSVRASLARRFGV